MLSARSMIHAEPREPVGVVAQHGAVGRAVEAQRGFLHPAQEARELLARGRRRCRSVCSSSQAPLIASHISHGERGAHRARVGARDLEAAADRGRIVGREGEEVDDGLARSPRRRPRRRRRRSRRSRRADSHSLVVAAIGGRQRGQALRRVEDAREIFGALHIAREPVQVVGGAARAWLERRPAPRCPWCRRPGSN